MLTDLLQDFGEVNVVVPHPFLYEMKVIIFTFLACLGLQTILDSVCFLAQYIHGPTQPVFITALCLLFMALRAGTGVQFFPSPWLLRASPLPWSTREVSKGESRCEVSLHHVHGPHASDLQPGYCEVGACRGSHTVQAKQHFAIVNTSVIMLAFTIVNCGWHD